MNFNEKLVYLRKKNGMTQESLAFKLGISRQSVSKWENGETEPELSKLRDIAKIFDVSFDYLLEDNEQEKIENTNNLELLTILQLKNKYNYMIWYTITIVAVFFFIVLFIVSSFSESVNTLRRGLLGFWLDNWRTEAILLKIIMFVLILCVVIGTIKLIRMRKNKNEEFDKSINE